MDIKSAWIATWHRMDHVVVTWTILQNHLLEVGLTQYRETVALRTLTTIDLFYFSMCENLHEWKFNEIAFGWGSGHIRLQTILEGMWPHCMILEMSWDGLWTLLLGSDDFIVMALGSCTYGQFRSLILLLLLIDSVWPLVSRNLGGFIPCR